MIGIVFTVLIIRYFISKVANYLSVTAVRNDFGLVDK